LHSQKLEEKAFLFLNHCPTHPSADAMKSKGGKIRAVSTKEYYGTDSANRLQHQLSL
jgi:hypothetical protein